MKAAKTHRVPLSQRVIEILEDMQTLRQGAEDRGTGVEPVFPGGKAGEPLSNTALLMLLRRMGRNDLTAHGFRSTFRDWVAERTSFQREVAEAALAHALGNKTEAAYERGDKFDKRRRLLMESWAAFCGTPKQDSQSNVAPMRQHS
jgi:integrase